MKHLYYCVSVSNERVAVACDFLDLIKAKNTRQFSQVVAVLRDEYLAWPVETKIR